MMRAIRKLTVVLLLALSAGALWAADLGLVINENFEAKDIDDLSLAWIQTASPWLSFTPAERLSFQLSLELSLEYVPTKDSAEDDDFDRWRPRFQVNQFGGIWTPRTGLSLEAGRVQYVDPLGLAVGGLFDGFNFSANLGRHSLNTAAFYTGLQYKERAKIVMTDGDLKDYADEDNYFAAKRFILSAFGQSRYLWNRENTLDYGGLVQFDLRGDDGEKLHSQYLLVKFSFPLFLAPGTSTIPVRGFPLDISLGGIFGIKEQDSGSAVSWAGNFSLAVPFPGGLTDLLSAEVFISSGSSGDTLRPYFPVSAITVGDVYTPSLSGLYIAKLSYQVNLLNAASSLQDAVHLNLTARYFWRTTDEIVPGIPVVSDSKDPGLGLELYGSGVWTPLSDLSFNLGMGVFIPDGPLKDADLPALWKVRLGITLLL